MKKLSFAALICILFTLLSCSDSETPSTVDTKPWTFDANMDTTYVPGDNFFMYCNGTWYKNYDLGNKPYWGLCGCESQLYIDENLKKMDSPTISKFWSNSTSIDQTTDAGEAILKKVMALTDNIQTKEDAWKAIAGVMKYGYRAIFRLGVYAENRICKAALLHDATTTVANTSAKETLIRLGYSAEKAENTCQLAQAAQAKLAKIAPDVLLSRTYLDTHPEIQDRIKPLSSLSTRGDSKQMLNTIYDELGINTNLVIYDNTTAYYSAVETLTPAEIKALLQTCIADDYKFTSHQALNSYNTAKNSHGSLKDYLQKFYSIYMNYILSHDYAKVAVTDEQKADMTGKCKELIASFKERIASLDWMSSTTKEKAYSKLDAMILNVGSPDQWIEEGLPTLTGTSLVEDLVQIRTSDFNAVKFLVGKTAQEYSFSKLILLDNGQDFTNLAIDNAAYSASDNSINILPIFLNKPYYSTEYSDAFNYSTFASAEGHEITHGFDVNGSRYDENGNNKNWWTVADKIEFQNREQKLVNCFNQLEIMPDELPNVYADGQKTLGENTADLGGLLMGFQAYMKKLAQEGYTGDELIKQQKRFFQAYGEQWRAKYTSTTAEYKLENDVHSLPKERINGIVMNVDKWYELYSVKFGDQLYLPTTERAYIW